MPGETPLIEICRDLVARYAAGVDRRDPDLLLSAFHPDATLTIEPFGDSADPPRVYRGHAELAGITERIRRYDRTFHFLGQLLLDGLTATAVDGEQYCVAHHWRTEAGVPTDTVMHLRYRDRYSVGADGWRIASRTLHLDGLETRPVSGGPAS